MDSRIFWINPYSQDVSAAEQKVSLRSIDDGNNNKKDDKNGNYKKNDDTQSYWEVPVYAEHTFARDDIKWGIVLRGRIWELEVSLLDDKTWKG